MGIKDKTNYDPAADDAVESPLWKALDALMGHAEKAREVMVLIQETVKEGDDEAGTALAAAKAIKDIDTTFATMEEDGLYRSYIVKVQRPISSNSPTAATDVLVYSENRDVMFEGPTIPAVHAQFKDGEFKIYVRARHWYNGVLEMLDRVEAQSW